MSQLPATQVKNTINNGNFNFLFIATELEWFPSHLLESEEFFKRNYTADFREIAVSKLKIKVEMKVDFYRYKHKYI